MGRETLPLKINWRLFTNDELVEAFEVFVKLNRPKSEPEPEPWKPSKGKGKGTTYYAQLTDLGTMRLFHVKPPLEVLKIINAADQSNLMRAAGRARLDLRNSSERMRTQSAEDRYQSKSAKVVGQDEVICGASSGGIGREMRSISRSIKA